MSRPIYEPTLQRTDTRLGYGQAQLFRRPAPAGLGYPITFRAAVGPIDNPDASRTHYLSDDDANSVYWDHWDLDFDATIFDTGPYEQTIFGYDVIAGVGLLALGLYSISAVIDLNAVVTGMMSLGTNYDEGQGQPHYVNNVAAGAQFWGDDYAIRVDQWRQVVDLPPPDNLWGGEATDVQITFSFSTTTDLGNVTGDSTPDGAGADVWIPGGYDGAWGLVPNMMVHYWGPMDGDADWPASVFDPPLS